MSGKYFELVRLDSGEAVVIGPFGTPGEAQDFSEHIESGAVPGIEGTGSSYLRALSVAQLARELGVRRSTLTPGEG